MNDKEYNNLLVICLSVVEGIGRGGDNSVRVHKDAIDRLTQYLKGAFEDA